MVSTRGSKRRALEVNVTPKATENGRALEEEAEKKRVEHQQWSPPTYIIIPDGLQHPTQQPYYGADICIKVNQMSLSILVSPASATMIEWFPPFWLGCNKRSVFSQAPDAKDSAPLL
ncbi:hypothetical protein Ancab_026537 [Ancistrocladus abbreviatus]